MSKGHFDLGESKPLPQETLYQIGSVLDNVKTLGNTIEVSDQIDLDSEYTQIVLITANGDFLGVIRPFDALDWRFYPYRKGDYQ